MRKERRFFFSHASLPPSSFVIGLSPSYGRASQSLLSQENHWADEEERQGRVDARRGRSSSFFSSSTSTSASRKKRVQLLLFLLSSFSLADFVFEHHETLERAHEIAPVQGIEKSCTKVVPIRGLFLSLSLCFSSPSTALSLSFSSIAFSVFVEIGCRRKSAEQTSSRLYQSSLQLSQNFNSTRTRSSGAPCLTTVGDAGSRLVRIRAQGETRARENLDPKMSRTHVRPNASGVGHRFTRTLAFRFRPPPARVTHKTPPFSFSSLSFPSPPFLSLPPLSLSLSLPKKH